ncbi:unnamed protein product [marine sediment metagenome]|uniref:Uncharacterized protein n=1 Tax=marine sediment metagenome TaxID=412755 RepID=X1UMS8_9ZZZZ
MAIIGSVIVVVLVYAAKVLLPILLAAWAFCRAFQVQHYLKLLKEIADELKRLNEFNEGHDKS